MGDIIGHPDNRYAEFLSRFKDGQASLSRNMILILFGLFAAWYWGVGGISSIVADHVEATEKLKKNESSLGDILININEPICEESKAKGQTAVDLVELAATTSCTVSQLQEILAKMGEKGTAIKPPFCMNTNEAAQLSNVCEDYKRHKDVSKNLKEYIVELDLLGTKVKIPWQLLFPASMALFMYSGLYLLHARRKLYRDLACCIEILRSEKGIDGRIERIVGNSTWWLGAPLRFLSRDDKGKWLLEKPSSDALSALGFNQFTAGLMLVAKLPLLGLLLSGAGFALWSGLYLTTEENNNYFYSDAFRIIVKYSTFLFWLVGVLAWVAAVILDGFAIKARPVISKIIEEPPNRFRLLLAGGVAGTVIAGTIWPQMFVMLGKRTLDFSAWTKKVSELGARPRSPRFIEPAEKRRRRLRRHSFISGLGNGFFLAEHRRDENFTVIQAVNAYRVLYVGENYSITMMARGGVYHNFGDLRDIFEKVDQSYSVRLNQRSAPFLVERSILDLIQRGATSDRYGLAEALREIDWWLNLGQKGGWQWERSLQGTVPRLKRLKVRLQQVMEGFEGPNSRRRGLAIWAMPLVESPRSQQGVVRVLEVNLSSGASRLVERRVEG